jgi:hypothetical protein
MFLEPNLRRNIFGGGMGMKKLAAVEVVVVFGAVILYIWRLQNVYPGFPIYTLAFVSATFFLHRDGLRHMGLGSHGFTPTLRYMWRPTLAAIAVLVMIGWLTGALTEVQLTQRTLNGFGRYLAWCALQQFGLQSFFSNRLAASVENPRHTTWISAAIFAAFHLPNPVLMPVTLFGGYLFTRLFLRYRNILPLAFVQAVVGILLSVALPVGWHHGLRVGPGYYRSSPRARPVATRRIGEIKGGVSFRYYPHSITTMQLAVAIAQREHSRHAPPDSIPFRHCATEFQYMKLISNLFLRSTLRTRPKRGNVQV